MIPTNIDMNNLRNVGNAFRKGWDFMGWTYAGDNIHVAVYLRKYAPIPESNDKEFEQELIDDGMKSLVCYKSINGPDYMRRVFTEDLPTYDFSIFEIECDDLNC